MDQIIDMKSHFCLVFTAPEKWRVELRAKTGHYRNRCLLKLNLNAGLENLSKMLVLSLCVYWCNSWSCFLINTCCLYIESWSILIWRRGKQKSDEFENTIFSRFYLLVTTLFDVSNLLTTNTSLKRQQVCWSLSVPFRENLHSYTLIAYPSFQLLCRNNLGNVYFDRIKCKSVHGWLNSGLNMTQRSRQLNARVEIHDFVLNDVWYMWLLLLLWLFCRF